MRTIKQIEMMGYEWGENYRSVSRTWLAQHIEGRMSNYIDAHLQRIIDRGENDCRNGYFRRHLLTDCDDPSVVGHPL